MPNNNAQFIFETNLSQVRSEIQAELGRIQAVVAQTSGSQGGDFLGGLTKGITKDVSNAIAEIRRIKAEADRVASQPGRVAAGRPTAALQFNDVIGGLNKQIEDRVRKAALKAGHELSDLDLRAVMGEVDRAFTKLARDEARALVRGIERTGTSRQQAAYGSSREIPTGVPRTTLTTPGDLQQQVAEEKRARRENAAAARRLAAGTTANAQANDEQAAETRQETGQRRTRQRRLAQSEEALTTANEQAVASTKRKPRVTKIDLEAAQKADSARVMRGINRDDPKFGYATKTGAPGTRVVDRSDPDNLRFFKEKGAGYEEITSALPEYGRLLRQENARLAKQQQAEAQAEADRLAALRINTQRLLGSIEAKAPGVGYITERQKPGKYAFEGMDYRSATIYKNTGSQEDPLFQKVEQGSAEWTRAMNRLAPIFTRLEPVFQAQVQAAQAEADRSFELAAAEAILRAALSRRIRASLMAADGEYSFNTPRNTPSKNVFNAQTGQLFRENPLGGYEEITEADRDYVRARRQHAQVVAARAVKEEAESAQDEEARAAVRRAYVQSQEIKARLASRDPSAQYLTDSGRPNARVALSPDGGVPTDPNTARYFERRGDNFVELQAGEQRYTDAQRLLTDQITDRTTNERRAREASERYAESLRKSSAGAVGVAGGGGFGGGLSTGLFSGGFGDNGDSPAFGLGRSLGQTVKYSLAYKAFNDLLAVLSQVSQEFLNVDDSYVELQYAMADGAGVTTDFVNALQDVAAPGGFNVGDAMDQAAASIRAYRDEILAADQDTQGLLQRDIGTNFAKAATQVAVIAKTSLADAAQNNRATALGFDLEPTTAGPRIADAISNAKLAGGGLEKDISQGGANIAEIAHAAGFSLEEALNVVSKLSAKLDESGQLSATRFSRMVGTLQGSAGKSFLTQLNQSLPTEKQININASPRDQILQIAAAYTSLNEAQKQQLATAIGGQAQQREFNVLVSSFPQLAKDAANSQVGLADKEYQDRLNNVRGLLGQIRGELRNIVSNLATSGFLAPFGLMLKILEPILAAVRDMTKTFNLIPSSIRNIGLALLGVYGTMKAITALRQRGGGSIVEGAKSMLQGAERAVLPGQALAREQMSLSGNHDDDFRNEVVAPAASARQGRLDEINQQEAAGKLTVGAASKARIQAEADYRAAIRANTDDYKKAAKAGTAAVEEGGGRIRSSFRSLRGDEIGNNVKVLRNALAQGPTVGAALRGIPTAIASTPGAIRSGGASVAAAFRAAAAEIRAQGPLGAAGGLASRLRGAAGDEGVGINAGRLGRGVSGAGRAVGGALRGAGALVASELGPIGIGLIAADLGLQFKESFDQIGDAQRTLANAASIDVNQGAAALSDAAKANEEAAKQMREASGGFFGSITNVLQGGAPGAAADRAQELAGQQAGLANRLRSQQSAASTSTGAAALASQINTSTGDDVNTSVKNLLDAGQDAGNVLDAITLALKSLKFAATGTVGDLTKLQQTDLAGRLGIAAGGVVPGRVQELQGERDAEQQRRDSLLNPEDRKKSQDRIDALQKQIDDLNNNGSTFIDNRVTDIVGRFFAGNPKANLNDPKTQGQVGRQIFDELVKKYGIDPLTANRAAGTAQSNLGAERNKFLAQLSTPEVAGALVQQGIGTAQLEADTTTGNSKLQSLRTGTPDRSVSAGIKVQRQRLLELQATTQANIDAMEAAGYDSSAYRLQLGVIENALVSTEVKQAEQLTADAKSDVDDIERTRVARQAAATSAAQVRAIGLQSITAELDKALPTHDPELIRTVMERASDAELDTYQRTLDNLAAAAEAEAEAARRRAIAQGELNPDGSARDAPPPPRPSPLAPGVPTPDDSALPWFLKPKAPKPAGVQSAEDKAKRAKERADEFKRRRAEVTTTGTAETGADAPGGTPEEKAASALGARAEKDRNSLEAAAAKVAAAKANMDKQKKGTAEYNQAQEAYFASLNAQADLIQDTDISKKRANLYPGDKLGAAKLDLEQAEEDLKRYAKGTKEYNDQLAKVRQVQITVAEETRNVKFLQDEASIDLSDPVASARLARQKAEKKRRDDIAAHADAGTIAQDTIDVHNTQNAENDAAFRQRISDAQTAEQLGRISHAAYIRFLNGEHDRLTERLKGMKKTDNGYRQAVDQLNEIDKDIKEANNQLQGQFNLGDIRVPTVYEVRRSMAAGTGTDVHAVTTSSSQVVNNNQQVTVNGADFAKVMDELYKIFGKTARHATQHRKA